MDGNEEEILELGNTEQQTTSKTTTFELQDLSSQCQSAATPDPTNNTDDSEKHTFECFVEEPSIPKVGEKRQARLSSQTSETGVHDKFKLDYLVSRPFLRPSTSAPGLGWSRDQLTDGLKIILTYSTKSEIIQNTNYNVVDETEIVDADSSTSNVASKQNVDEESGPPPVLRTPPRESCSHDGAVSTGGLCPTFFYSLDAGSLTSTSDEGLDGNLCRICYMGDKHEDFIQPPACVCAGTMQYCHQSCLSNWVAQSGIKKCELCSYRFRIKTVNMLQITNWTCIPMTTLDKLYIWLFLLACSFIITTGVYVCWAMLSTSDSAMMERESTAAQVLFPVYTGFDLFCLSIIMYVLKDRITLMWRKWRAHNRSIVILGRPTEHEV